jgi:hypothetical protein
MNHRAIPAPPIRLISEPPPHSMMPIISGSELGEYAGALGGAALAVRRWTPAKMTDTTASF